MAGYKYITKKSKDFSILDRNTGDLLDYNQTMRVPVEKFIMVFFASYPEIMQLEGQKVKILMICWLKSTFSEENKANRIVNNKDFKETVRSYMPKVSDSTIDLAFSTFVKRGLLIRVCKGLYELNPSYFFRGKLSDRTHIKYSFEVDPSDKAKEESIEDKNVTEMGPAICMFLKSGNMYMMEKEENKQD